MRTCRYLLIRKISEICNKSEIELVFRNKSGTQLDMIKKKLQRLFKE